jgi:hypothetical protein
MACNFQYWQANTGTPLLAQFDVIQDGQWHYTCLNVGELIPSDGLSFLSGMRFWTYDQSPSTYSRNPFWIDEISIATVPRQVTQTAYPMLSGLVGRFISVTRIQAPGGFTWSVVLTSSNCSAPMVQFELDVSGITVGQVAVANAVRVREHSAPIEGNIVLSFQDETIAFGPYSTAKTVLEILVAFSAVGGAEVHRAGVCQTGFSWLITFTHTAGDLPLLRYSNGSLRGAHVKASVYVETVTNGGLLIAPLSADYFQVQTASSNVQMWINDDSSRCVSPVEGSACSFDFSDDLTPTIMGAESVSESPSVRNNKAFASYLISGSRLDPVDANSSFPSVIIEQQECQVISSSNLQILCILARAISAGSHSVRVNVPGRGWARGNVSVFFPLTVVSVSPTSISLTWPTVLKITGTGFSVSNISENVMSLQVLVAEQTSTLICMPLNSTVNELYCLITPRQISWEPSTSSSLPRRLITDEAGILAHITVGGVQVSATYGLNVNFLAIPEVHSIVPTQGPGGGDTRITVYGTSFSNDRSAVSVFLGPTVCPVIISNTTAIVCLTLPSKAAVLNVTVRVSEIGYSLPSSAAVFQYVFEISRIDPNAVGIGGGSSVTLSGRGFLNSAGIQANFSMISPTLDVYVVSLSTPQQFTEILDIIVTGVFKPSVQTVIIYQAWVTFIFLTLDGNSSILVPRDIDSYSMQLQLQRIVQRGGLRVTREQWSDEIIIFTVEFTGNHGSVPLIRAFGCHGDTRSACKYNTGVNTSVLTAGQSPIGSFLLNLGGLSSTFRVDSTVMELSSAISNLLIPKGVTVTLFERSFAVTWRVIFNAINVLPLFFSVDDSGVIGGSVSAVRVREGSLAPIGRWKVGVGGFYSRWLALNASDVDVREAILEQAPLWGDIASVEVIRVENLPGKLLDRAYPQQWAIRLGRFNSLHSQGLERCTNPLYVDWDPSSCPVVASDLYLAFSPHFWPRFLPTPSDLGSDSYRSSIMSDCDAEAVALGVRPSVCEALLPQETLQYCGIGSGASPPCWISRFSEAKVSHRDGRIFNYILDNKMSPSDTAKGYIFWRRADYNEQIKQQEVVLNASLESFGSAMQIGFYRSFSGVKLPVNATILNDSTTLVVLPPFFQYMRSYAQRLSMDVFFRPLVTWRLNLLLLDGAKHPYTSTNVSASTGVLQSGLSCSFSSDKQSSVQLSIPSRTIVDQFTLEFWVRLDEQDLRPDACNFVVRTLGEVGIDCAVVLCRSANQLHTIFQFWLRTSLSLLDPFTVLEARFGVPGEWTHLAVSYDGERMRLYGGGLQVNSSASSVNRAKLDVSLIALSSGCDMVSKYFSTMPAPDPACIGVHDTDTIYQPFHGHIDWLLVYNTALPDAVIASHSSIFNTKDTLTVQAQHGPIKSDCKDCLLTLEGSITPIIFSIQPEIGCPGINLTLSGRFSVDSTRRILVRLGNNACTVLEASQTLLLCSVSPMQKLGLIPVTVTDVNTGSSEVFNYLITSWIFAVHPEIGGSIFGGARLTIVGSGFASHQPSAISILVGNDSCDLISTSYDSIICEVQQRLPPYDAIELQAVVNVNIDSVSAQHMCHQPTNKITQSQDASALKLMSNIFTRTCQLKDLRSQLNGSEEYSRTYMSLGIQSLDKCVFFLSIARTPIITGIEPRFVASGTHVVLQGRDLPESEGPPRISIGKTTCEVKEFNSSYVSCVVGAGEGGNQQIFAKYMQGFSIELQSQYCEKSVLSYIPSVFSVDPSLISTVGGVMVTIVGTGFSVTPELNEVLIGNIWCRVVNASIEKLIVSLPPQVMPIEIENSLELSILSFHKCMASTPALCRDSSGANLKECFLSMYLADSGNKLAYDQSRVLVFPSDNTLETHLVDTNLKTIWRSKQGENNVSIALDLGEVQFITAVRLSWFGNHSAARYGVAISDMCNDFRNMTISSFCWPYLPSRNLARSCGSDGSSACTASQSSTYRSSMQASMAVDGNQTSAFSCSQTNCQTEPWWRIDFNSTKKVRGGTVWNRRDSFAEKLDGFQVWIGNGSTIYSGNRLCYSATNIPVSFFASTFSLSFDCVGIGKYLYISVPRYECLSICEVEVYEETIGCRIPTWNEMNVIPFNTEARFVLVQLMNLREGESEYRLRDIQVVGNNRGNKQQLMTMVNSIEAQCHSQSSCTVTFEGHASLLTVLPDSGLTGETITIKGSGFSEICSEMKILIGTAYCPVRNCSNWFLECVLTDHPPGLYSLSVATKLGRAIGQLSFTYGFRVTRVLPSTAGVGGGAPILLEGRGLPWVGNASVFVCGIGCVVETANSSVIKIIAPILADAPKAVQNVFVVNVQDDVLEFSVPYCQNYSRRSSYCICEAEQWQCYSLRYQGRVLGTKSGATASWRTSGMQKGQIWGCDCTGRAGTVVYDSKTLGFDLIGGGSFYTNYSPQSVYLRFENLDIASGSRVLSASLLVYPGSALCPASSIIRVWAELSTNSRSFNAEPRLPLYLRQRTQSFVDWTIRSRWKWAFRQEGSADLSILLNEVIRTSNWRAGNAITLILRQLVTEGVGTCQFLSSEAGISYTPSLRIKAENSLKQDGSLASCQVNVSAPVHPLSSIPTDECSNELSATVSVQHPTAGAINSEEDLSTVSQRVACCFSTVHSAILALDSEDGTYWMSQEMKDVNFTLDLGESGAVVTMMRMLWTKDFAKHYQILVLNSDDVWEMVHNEINGHGGYDEFDVIASDERKRFRYLRISMLWPGMVGQKAFGIREIVLFGCGQGLDNSLLTEVVPNMLSLTQGLSPVIFSFHPSMGSTAGGNKITITGSFQVDSISQISVNIGSFPCNILSLNSTDQTNQTVVCKSVSTGLLNGGLKYVEVVSLSAGASVHSSQHAFWYIDAWSARSTWGGNAPPTGCGDYTIQPDCQESVIIPQGQVVLLDISPPRLFLLLIQGTLIFDRMDLHLKVFCSF